MLGVPGRCHLARTWKATPPVTRTESGVEEQGETDDLVGLLGLVARQRGGEICAGRIAPPRYPLDEVLGVS